MREKKQERKKSRTKISYQLATTMDNWRIIPLDHLRSLMKHFQIFNCLSGERGKEALILSFLTHIVQGWTRL